MILIKKKSYSKTLIIVASILVFTFSFSCKNNDVDAIVTISRQEIESLFPKDYTFQHLENRPSGFISKNGKRKYIYEANKFSNKFEVQNAYLLDTIDERILRTIFLDTITENNFLLDFRLTDLHSDRIPEIFGNRKKKDMHYEVISIKSLPNSTISKSELLRITPYLIKEY